ncbi:MAG TPA: M56 family metallopeptidase [Gemmatimonadaceae bacterium]|nr:M56 family metallopeptidase [Gemmatimonadaceae bacterium]
MIASWMLATAFFTACAALAAWAAERALRAVGRAGRGPWIVACAAAIAWPLLAPLASRVAGALRDGSHAATAAALPALRIIAHPLPAWIGGGARGETVLAALWMTASLLLSARLLRSLRVLRHAQRRAHEQVLDGVSVLVTPALGPAAVGTRHPRIIVPRWLFDLEAPLRADVLRHEEEHCRARDPWIILGAALGTALFPWNPALWWISRRLHLALEEDCDARVLRTGASVERYGKLLVLIAHRQSVTRRAPVMAASNSHLERRILAMHAPRPARPVLHLVAFGTLALAAVAIACSSPVADAPGSTTTASDRAAANAPAGGPYFEFQISNPASPRAGNPVPHYPDSLAAAHVSGAVIGQFVVNADGTVDTTTFKVLKSSAPEFTIAVRQVLPSWRYNPARAGNGAPVRQVVQQPFLFSEKMK